MERIKIVFLASGNGGTLKFVHQAIHLLKIEADVVSVISDRECGAIQYACENNIPCKIFRPWKDFTDEICAEICKYHPDIVVTNIHKVLSSKIFTCGRSHFINLHYSLLPAFGGVIGFKTLEMAKEANTRIIGATCHYVTEQLDGGKVIAQAAIPVDWKDDYTAIGNQIFRIACETIPNGILIVSDMKLGESSNGEVLYSPSLRYDNSTFTESYWDKISKL